MPEKESGNISSLQDVLFFKITFKKICSLILKIALEFNSQNKLTGPYIY